MSGITPKEILSWLELSEGYSTNNKFRSISLIIFLMRDRRCLGQVARNYWQQHGWAELFLLVTYGLMMLPDCYMANLTCLYAADNLATKSQMPGPIIFCIGNIHWSMRIRPQVTQLWISKQEQLQLEGKRHESCLTSPTSRGLVSHCCFQIRPRGRLLSLLRSQKGPCLGALVIERWRG